MGWEQLEDGRAVTAAARPLPPLPPNVTRWTNQAAEAAFRRGIEIGERRATDNVVRAAAAAAAPPRPAPKPAAKPIPPKPPAASRPSKPAAPPRTQGVMVTMMGQPPMLLVKDASEAKR